MAGSGPLQAAGDAAGGVELPGPGEAVASDGAEGFGDVHGLHRLHAERFLDLPPLHALVGGDDVGLAVGDLLPDEQRPVAFEAELIDGVEEGAVVVDAGTVLLVVLDDGARADEVDRLAAGAPEGGVEAGIELVMDGEEGTDVVPLG